MKNKQRGFIPVLIVVIAVVAIGGGAYVYTQNKQIDTAIETNVQNNTDTQIATTSTNTSSASSTSSSQTITWKTYTNSKYKFSFSYPSNYKIITDGVKTDYNANTSGEEWYRVELSDTTSTEKPYLTFEVNPDGYGPIFADKMYKVQATSEGKLSILSEQVSTPDENTRDGKTIIVVPSTQFSNGNSYYFRFSFNDSGKNLESTFKQIVASFKATASVSISNDFTFKIGDTYAVTKAQLVAKGWTPVIPTSYQTQSGAVSQTPISAEYPEISYCGSGSMAICTVDFQKGSVKKHLNLKAGSWIVSGNE